MHILLENFSFGLSNLINLLTTFLLHCLNVFFIFSISKRGFNLFFYSWGIHFYIYDFKSVRGGVQPCELVTGYQNNESISKCSRLFYSETASFARRVALEKCVNERTNLIFSFLQRPTASSEHRRCVDCGTKETPLWRLTADKQPVCNACQLYFKLHKVTIDFKSMSS